MRILYRSLTNTMKYINKRHIAFLAIGEGTNFLVTSFGKYMNISGDADALRALEAELTSPGEPDLVRIPDSVRTVTHFKE